MVRSLGVFGSYVRGEQASTSGLDVLVAPDRAPPLELGVRYERMEARHDLVLTASRGRRHGFRRRDATPCHAHPVRFHHLSRCATIASHAGSRLRVQSNDNVTGAKLTVK